MCTGFEMAVLGGMIAGTAAQADGQRKAANAAEDANKQAVKQATLQADQADQATNKANAKTPDIAAMFAENVLNAKGGQSGTMLTGAQGVDPNSLLLGKKTLLGGG